MEYMVTHSLLSAWLYTMKENPYEDASQEERDPFATFLLTLMREPTEQTQAMKDGIDFENLVTEIINGRYDTPADDLLPDEAEYERFINSAYFKAAERVATMLKGSILQCRAYKTVRVNGLDIFLYGRLDALKAGTIYDVKYSKKYERGKYIGSTQHLTYFEVVPEAERFVYIISNGVDVWTEEYRRDETDSIIPIISDFLDWLDVVDLKSTFMTFWKKA